MTEKQIKIDQKDVTVKKLAVGDFATVLSIFQETFEKFSEYKDVDFGTMSNNDYVGLMPRLLADALPQVSKIAALATDLTADEFQQLGLDEASDILVAFLELNNFQKIFGNAKKMMALSGSNSAPTNGSSESSTPSPLPTDGVVAKS